MIDSYKTQECTGCGKSIVTVVPECGACTLKRNREQMGVLGLTKALDQHADKFRAKVQDSLGRYQDRVSGKA